ncbi:MULTISPECIES: TraX family protein [unclassified Paenibacillus]|uniref:TraX family protein n=1 Tax=unclassified Paenibacillus TaxID=185978 RepID=UPI002788EAD5|nr:MULTISPECIES: TraX family protein [unclassified Paenibacillus]MDQ0896330.1 hypothetical protein [Paenibacillus sp. V4I7]MDQ0913744.1 hypothetical protein [Paenibacillus sp. V4I5]
MEWLAMITMIIDHIGYVWFPNIPDWRIIGRIAFPIYAFGVARGMSFTRDPQKYIFRLLFLAVISQLPYSLLFKNESINVIAAFTIIVFALYRVEAAEKLREKLFWFIGAGLLLDISGTDYGSYALLLVAIYRYTRGFEAIFLHILINIFAWFAFHMPLQVWSIIPTLALAWVPLSKAEISPKFKVPSWLWRSFYPVHLMMLWLLAYFLH